MSKKTVEQIYQKKTQHEHILARPDMYIGTIEPVTEDAWVFDEADNIMKQRRCTWIPGLYKIFDEILVNASDNKVRDFEGQTQIKVWIDGEKGMVRVFNNGEGIPVAKHKEHDLWVSEMIFGHLMTGSNYDDTEAKVTGGRNGFGAKLTNVFSSRFEVESAHSRSRKKFQMTWTNNMLNKEEAKITAYDGPDYTMITFYPDFAKFNTTGFGEDMLLIMKRRVYDIAGCTDKSLKCYLNGQKLPINTFPEYVDLFPTMGEEKKAASYSRVGDRWEVCVRVSNMGFQQVSFVNSIATTRGGNHVRYITDQIIAKVTDAAKKRKVEAKPHMIKPHLFVFINCQIENPGFDSQTKDTLNTTKPKFGSSCDLPNSMIDYILKSGIVERTVEMANSKLQKEMASKLKNSDRRQVLGIPKLDDANEAGGKYSSRCTLILTEGDSAKALCTAGLAVKDRDYFGVFPLRGKPLNVRDANLKKVMACEEIQSVMKIMGLDMRQNYTSPDSLRYGHLMIMSDQDHDGSHIKGLIINFIHHYWPELVKFPGFLQQFITPIVKAREKGSQRSVSFFSMPTYLEWRQRLGPAATAKYDIRYYKGLGTSGSKEGREYFENIDRHRLDFVFNSARDDERIKMAFAKDKVEDRKQWITAFRNNENAAEQMDYSIKRVPYSDFIDKELILFSVADCERSIPSVVDGLKPGQRKVLFSCFKRNLVKAIKVAQLAGYVSEHSAYHHGEASLVATIVALAQDFVGSNNLPILQQDGQFGTRLQGGKDHAAGRYIFTRLTTAARLLYHRDDDFTVDYRDDDGLSVEPFYYVPVIPMVLVNGTAGIGTGFATNIPNYSPYDVIHNIRRLLQGEELLPMAPWYFGFKGTIEEKEKGKFISRGKMNVLPNNVISITELPIGTWTQPYKKYLEDLREREVVVQYREYNTDVTVDFEIMLHPTAFELWSAQGVLEERLQLREYIHATNIIAFSKDGQLTKYADAEAVIKEFYLIRIDYYNRRKDYMLGELRRAVSKLENMVRFVREVVAGTLVVTRRKKKELLDELVSKKYVAFPPAQKKKLSSTTIGDGEGDAPQQNVEDLEDQYLAAAVGEDAGRDADEAVSKASRDYDYLLGMKLWSLTLEMINRLEAQMQRAKADLTTLEKRTPREMWSDDLDALERHMKKHYADREAEISGILKKKLGLKREFEAHRVRVPVLSDKARAALSKDSEKFSKANKKSAKDGDDGTAEAQPKPKKVVKRKKKKKSSDSEDNVDSSSDEDDDSGPDPFGDEEAPAKAPRAPRAKAAAAPKAKKAPAPKRAKKKKGSDSDESSPDDSSEESSAASGESDSDAPLVAKKKASTKPPPKSKGARTESGSKPSGAKAAAVNVDDDDDFLSGFGLGAIGGSHPEKKASPPKPKATARPQAATAQKPAAPSFLDDDDDDLLTLGERKAVAPPPPTARKISVAGAVAAAKPAPKAAAKKPAKKRRRGSDSESSDSSSEESSDESDFDF